MNDDTCHPHPLAAGQGAGGAVVPDAPRPAGQGDAAGGDRVARGSQPLPRGISGEFQPALHEGGVGGRGPPPAAAEVGHA